MTREPYIQSFNDYSTEPVVTVNPDGSLTCVVRTRSTVMQTSMSRDQVQNMLAFMPIDQVRAMMGNTLTDMLNRNNNG